MASYTKSKKKLLSRKIALFILIIIPIVTFFLGTKYQNKTEVKSKNECEEYGYSKKEQFLEQYFVKRGDTLLSIATTTLGNSSRVNDLIELNRDRYPELSINKPFIEQGWILFLPPLYNTPTGGNIREIKGVLTNIRSSDGSYEISSPGGHFATVTLDKNTKLIGKSAFTVGECIKAIVADNIVFSIAIQ